MNLHEVQQHRLRIERYLQPQSVAEALEMLGAHGDRARLIAGGTDLLLEMARGQRPGIDTLIDLSRVEELNRLSVENGDVRIGAGVTHNEIVASPSVGTAAPPLAQACWEVGSPQLRNRATVVGNVVTASPANDTLTALRALGTVVEIASAGGLREIDLADFHRGVRQIDLGQDEVVTGLRVRAMGPFERGLFVKLGLRRAQAISVVHLAIVLNFDGESVAEAAVALGSVAPTIIRVSEAESYLVGKILDEETITEAASMVAARPMPIDDLRATAWYRTAQLKTMTLRALNALARSQSIRSLRPSPVTLGGRRGGGSAKTVVNGREVQVSAATTGTLLDWLRDEIGLTGSKEGCAEGECGACTVFLDGAAVMSCLVPAGRASGSEIVTIEGLASDGRLHPLQQAFLDEGSVQCGFCIPGFLMAGAKLLEERSSPTPEEVRIAFSGNLCRCTGYYKIMAAVDRAAGR